MACDRCSDIHQAQREGKTAKKCECDCHIYSNNESECTCYTYTGFICPVHGNSFIDTSGGGSVDIYSIQVVRPVQTW